MFSVFFCPYCKYFICEKCGKELSNNTTNNNRYNSYQSCINHNIILLIDIKAIKKSKTNLTFDTFKIGDNLFKDFKFVPSAYFFCNLCHKDYKTNRFMCLNCRGPEIFYDVENNGYVDICEFCILKHIAFSKELESKESTIMSVFEKEIYADEEHQMRSHVYFRLNASSGFYYLN